MIFRIGFVTLLLLCLFYGLLQLAFRSPLAKLWAAIRGALKRLAIFAIALVLTGVVIAFIVTVDHIS